MVLISLPNGGCCLRESLLGIRFLRQASGAPSSALPALVWSNVLSYLQAQRPVGRFISAGLVHTCALTAEGRLVCFGSNGHGQCAVPGGLENVVSVAAGYDHTCALTAEGHLICFGSNGSGQCAVPGGLENVVSVAAGSEHTCALTAEGNLVCFGWNLRGQCAVPPDMVGRVPTASCPASFLPASDGLVIDGSIEHNEPATVIDPMKQRR